MANGFDLGELTAYQKKILKVSNDVLPKESKKFLKTNATKLSGVQKKQFKAVPMDKVENAEKAMVKAYKKGFQFQGHFTGKARAYTLKSMKSGKVGKKSGVLYCKAGGRGILNLISEGYTHKGGFKNKTGVESFIKGYKVIDKANKQFEGDYYKNCEEFIEDISGKL